MELFFDTETSDLPKWKLPDEHPSQPWTVQLAAVLSDSERIYGSINLIIESEGRPMSPYAQKVHGISTTMADNLGVTELFAAMAFSNLAINAERFVAHNIDFDKRLLRGLYLRGGYKLDLNSFDSAKKNCTMKQSTQFCKLPKSRGGYKWPKLTELYQILFEETFEGAHDALVDVMATRRCYYELVNRGVIKP
jgi:DNA polymerase III epsilon subunit-like protein